MFHEIEDLMKKNNNGGNVVDDENNGSNGNRFSRWHNNSSRIIRVSRASGGKDRHSKVWTSKGPRDRRVRLSVSTALQFYDLQDRLGYDQPSKAIEWLIKAAEDSISELPILNTTFPNDQETLRNQTIATTNTTNSMSKSGCSSNSDTSKNSSGLSLSRSELRDKARERARERTAKETKERHDDNHHQDNHHHDHHHHHHHTSFTELLTAGRQWITTSPTSSTHQHPPMEYLSNSGLIGQNNFPIQTFMSDNDHHQHHDQHQELSFVPEHLISPGSGGGGFNLDFNMSTSSSNVVAATTNGFSGYNRGTLQSNSTNHQSFLTNLQRYNTSSENGNNGNGGGGAQFLFGALPVDNHNQHHHQFQLYYENGCRNSDQKGKGKN